MIFEICRVSDPYGEKKPYKDAKLGWIDECKIHHYILEISDLDALLCFKSDVKKSVIIGTRINARGGEPKHIITIYDDYIE